MVVVLLIAMAVGPHQGSVAPTAAQSIMTSKSTAANDADERHLIVVPDPDPEATGRYLDDWASASAPLTPLW